MMQNFIFGLFLLTSSSFALITGQVLSNQNEPISGAVVSLKGAKTQTLTDQNGAFSIGEEDIVSLQKNQQSLFTGRVELRGNYLSIAGLEGKSEVALMVFQAGGKLLSQKRIRVSHQKEVQFSLQKLANHHDGILFLDLRVDGQRFLTQVAPVGIRGSYELKGGLRLSEEIPLDTLVIEKSNFLTQNIPVFSYDLSDLSIQLLPSVSGDSFFRLTYGDFETKTPHDVLAIVQITNEDYFGVTDLENCVETSLCEFYVDGVLLGDESEIEVNSLQGFSIQEPTVLLIDNSTSISKSQLESVIDAAKDFVRQRVSKGPLAIYSYSSEVKVFSDFTGDSTQLLSALDLMKSVGPYGASTKLWGAIDTALSILPQNFDVLNQELTQGQVVVFTDGLDTEGSKSMADVQITQSMGGLHKPIWLVLGTWAGVHSAQFDGLFGARVTTVSEASSLNEGFQWVDTNMRQLLASHYFLRYGSAKRGDLVHTFQMNLAGNTNTGSDSVALFTFNSKDFVDGYPPEVRDIFITREADVLTASYTYFDPEGLPEGNSLFQWGRTMTPGDYLTTIEGEESAQLTLPSDVRQGEHFQVTITPAQFIGTPTFGESDTASLYLGYGAMANNVNIVGTPMQGDTLWANYNYFDYEGDLEGETEFEWYYYFPNSYSYSAAIPGATQRFFVPQEKDKGKVMGVGVKANAATGFFANRSGFAKDHLDASEIITGWNPPTVENADVVGGVHEGDTVEVVYDFVDSEGDTEMGTTYQWFRSGAPIAGENGRTYVIGKDDQFGSLYVGIVPRTEDKAPFVGDTVYSQSHSTSGCVDGKTMELRTRKTYSCKKINGRYWMTEDLKYVVSGNGGCYGGDAQYCENVGALYSKIWLGNICPTGWMASDASAWHDLLTFMGQDRGDQTTQTVSDPAGDYTKYRLARYLKAESGWVHAVDWAQVTVPTFVNGVTFPNGHDSYGLNIMPNGSYEDGSYVGYGGSTVLDKNGSSVEGGFNRAEYILDTGNIVRIDIDGWVSVDQAPSASAYWGHLRCVERL